MMAFTGWAPERKHLSKGRQRAGTSMVGVTTLCGRKQKGLKVYSEDVMKKAGNYYWSLPDLREAGDKAHSEEPFDTLQRLCEQ